MAQTVMRRAVYILLPYGVSAFTRIDQNVLISARSSCCRAVPLQVWVSRSQLSRFSKQKQNCPFFAFFSNNNCSSIMDLGMSKVALFLLKIFCLILCVSPISFYSDIESARLHSDSLLSREMNISVVSSLVESDWSARGHGWWYGQSWSTTDLFD